MLWSNCHFHLTVKGNSHLGFPSDSAGKESTCNAGDLGSVPGLGRFPGEGNGYPLQYSGLENSMDCIVHGVTKSWTWLSEFHFTFHMKHQEFSTAVLLCWWCIYIYFYLAAGLCVNSLFWRDNLFCLLDTELYVVNSQVAPECLRKVWHFSWQLLQFPFLCSNPSSSQ